MKFEIGADGSLTVQGSIKRESDRAKITELLQGLEGINKVIDLMTVTAPARKPQARPETEHESTPDDVSPQKPVATGDGGDEKTYTVKSGDTLWQIAKQLYGEGSKYMQIFEANKDLLNDPDHIYPGQELKIPPERD